MIKMYLWEEWNEVGISVEGRKKLNKVIRLANEWQTEHRFDTFKGRVVIAEVERGLRTFDVDDRAYREVLKEIQDFVVPLVEPQ